MWPQIRQSVTSRRAPHQQYAPIVAPPSSRFSLYAGEPEACRRDLRQFVPILAHLGLMLAVFKVYRVEGRAFQMLVTIALAVLPVHYFLPYRWKKPAFVAV